MRGIAGLHRCHAFWKVGDEPRWVNHIRRIDTIRMIGTTGVASEAEKAAAAYVNDWGGWEIEARRASVTNTVRIDQAGFQEMLCYQRRIAVKHCIAVKRYVEQ